MKGLNITSEDIRWPAEIGTTTTTTTLHPVGLGCGFLNIITCKAKANK